MIGHKSFPNFLNVHGKSHPVLDARHRLLTHKCQLDMCAGLNRAQANTSSMFGVITNTRIRITGNRATGLRKDNASVIAVNLGSVTRENNVSLGGDDGPNETTVLPWKIEQ